MTSWFVMQKAGEPMLMDISTKMFINLSEEKILQSLSNAGQKHG